MKKCNELKNYEYITKNLEVWKRIKGLEGTTSRINANDHIENADKDEELLEIMISLASEQNEDNIAVEKQVGNNIHKDDSQEKE